MVKIHQIFTNSPQSNFTYLVEYSNGQVISVDPYYSDQIMAYLKAHNLTLKSIINTHEHRDHTCGNNELKAITKVKVWGYIGLSRDVKIDVYFDNNDEIQLDKETKLKIVFTPGHTLNSVCLEVYDKDKLTAVLTGDTLFNAGVGNCYSGDVEKLYDSFVNYFYELDNYVLIYPGHNYMKNNCNFTLSIEKDNGSVTEMLEKHRIARANDTYYTTTIKEEREINLFFRLDKVREILCPDEDYDDKKVFFRLRELRNNW